MAAWIGVHSVENNCTKLVPALLLDQNNCLPKLILA